MEHAYGILHAVIGSSPLDRLYDDLLSLFFRLELGIITNILDSLGCVCFGFIRHILYEQLPGLFARHAGNAFKLLIFFLNQFPKSRLLFFKLPDSIFNRAF